MRVSVTTKIFLSLTGVLATFAAVAIYSIFTLRSIGLQLEVIDEGYIPLTKVAAELEARQSKAASDLADLKVKDRHNLNLLRRFYPGSIAARVSRLLRLARQIVKTNLSRRRPKRAAAFFARVGHTLTALRSQLHENVTNLARLLTALGRGHPREIRTLRSRLRRGEGFVLKSVRGLSGELDGRVTATVLNIRREERTSAWVVMGLAVLAAAVGLLLVLYAQYTLRPIKQLTEGVSRIAGGDYDQRVQLTTRDEIGVLAREFNRMAESLEQRDRALEEEKRFSENIVESIRSGVVVTDVRGRVTALNEAAKGLLELSLGKDPCAAGVLAGVAELPGRLEAALAGEETTLEAVAVSQGRFLDLKLAPFRDAAGHLQGALLIAEDVTEKVHTKAQLVKSERLAAVGRIAAQITHEIRNPLSSIGLNTELLGEEVVRHAADAGEARHLVDAIAREVDRLTAVTEEYLRYARFPQPRFEREVVNDIIADLLRFMEEEFRSRRIAVESSLAAELPPVEADENQLRQGLLNLMRNSCESMREGGTLRVTTGATATGVKIVISDDGLGIAPEHLDRVFDPFFSTKDGGTGLGLALTHQIIEEHGGAIVVHSELGQGTTFTITFPKA